MFGLSKKKYKPLVEYPENWSILEEKTTGFFVRINSGYKEAVGHPDYPIRMGVALPVSGEHDEKVMKVKHEMEDTISEILNKNGVLVAVITQVEGQKFIEFLSYTRNGIDFQSLHQTLKDKFPAEDVQMYAEPDPKWSVYMEFAKNIK